MTVRWGDYHPEYAGAMAMPDSEGESFALEPVQRCQTEETAQDRCLVAPAARATRRAFRSTAHSIGPARKPSPSSDGLRLVWLSRPAPREALDETLVPDGAQTVNVYLVNTREPTTGAAKDRSTAFQAELTVTCAAWLRAPTQPERPEFARR